MIINGEEFVLSLEVKDLEKNKIVFENDYDNFDELNVALNSGEIEEPFESEVNVDVCFKEGENLILLFGKELDMVFPLDIDEIEDLVQAMNEWTTPKDIELTPYKGTDFVEEDIVSKKKDLSIYEYVCPRCWYPVKQCKCRSYPYYLIQIDKNILPIARTLNLKGYITQASCEGHSDESHTSIQLYFKEKYLFKLPSITNLNYHNNGDLQIDVEGKDVEEKEKNKKEILNILTEWSNGLPKNK